MSPEEAFELVGRSAVGAVSFCLKRAGGGGLGLDLQSTSYQFLHILLYVYIYTHVYTCIHTVLYRFILPYNMHHCVYAYIHIHTW